MGSLGGIALELLEYKLDALVARRPVRGGVASLWDLHRVIEVERDALGPDERQRFDEVARRLRAVSDLPTRGSALRTDINDLRLDEGAPNADDAVLDVEEAVVSVDDPALLEERRALLRLAERVWWDELDAVVATLAPA